MKELVEEYPRVDIELDKRRKKETSRLEPKIETLPPPGGYQSSKGGDKTQKGLAPVACGSLNLPSTTLCCGVT